MTIEVRPKVGDLVRITLRGPSYGRAGLVMNAPWSGSNDYLAIQIAETGDVLAVSTRNIQILQRKEDYDRVQLPA